VIVERTVPPADRLERLVDSLPAAVVQTRDEIIVYCNRTFAAMMGESVDALVGRTMWSLVVPEHVERAQMRYVDRQRGGPVPESWEFTLLRRDGRRVHVEAEPRVIGENEHLILLRDRGDSLHDIDLANKLSALALRLQRERSIDAVIRTAAIGLRELGMQMQALEHRGDVAVVHPTPPTPFSTLYEELVGTPFVEARFPLDAARIVRPLVEEGRPIYVDDSRSLVEEVLRHLDPKVVERLAAASAKRMVVAPLFLAHRAWGALVIGASWLTSRDAATLALFTSQVASAMEVARTIDELGRANRGLQAIQAENDRLYRETRRRLDLLSVQYGLSRAIAGALEERSLADRALEVLTNRLGVDAGWVYARHEERLRLVGARSRGGDDPAAVLDSELALDRSTACGNAALDRAAVVLDLEAGPGPAAHRSRALGMRHVVAVPLLVEEELIGALGLASKGPDPFDGETLQLVESCAIQLAVALERSRLFAEERRRVHDLSRLNELGNLISQHLELPALLSLGIDHVQRMVEVPEVLLSLLDPDGGPLRVVATNVREPGVLGIVIDRDDASAAAAAVRELRPVLIEDPLNDPRAARALSLRFGHKALLSVPLISRGEAIGAITFCETREGRRFTPAAIERAVAVANQLAAAIANARLFEEERHRVHELSLLAELGRIASGTLQRDVLLSECVGQIRGTLGFQSGAAFVVGRNGLECAIVQEEGFDHELVAGPLEALASRALAAGTPIAHADGAFHACALPLLAGPQAGGVLAFARKNKPVSDADLRTLAAAAPELGVALQNARLYDDARRRVEELRLLLDIGRAITGSLDLDGILETSAGILSRITDGSNAFILLLDAGAGALRGAACSNPVWREEFRQVRISLDDDRSVAVRCVRLRAPVAVADVAASEFAANERVVRFQEASVLAVPLLVRDEPIGCVLVDDTRGPREWSAPEIERAALIGHQLAVAVANARLYDDLKRSYGELARTQEELVKRERLAALGELSAVVAHEVRNPLGVIFNSLGSLRKLLRPTGDGAMLLDIVEEEADRLDRIVRDLLDFARPNEPALEPERLDGLLADTIQAAQGDRIPAGVKVELEVPPDLPLVRIDARMIRQVLLNLVLNGMQAMPRGGTLRVRAERDPADGRMVRVEFIDQGTGVPPELAPRIFQPFFTTKAAGTGLGLAVVKRFVDAHGGTIHFHSRQGEGTTFILRLPVDEAV